MANRNPMTGGPCQPGGLCVDDYGNIIVTSSTSGVNTAGMTLGAVHSEFKAAVDAAMANRATDPVTPADLQRHSWRDITRYGWGAGGGGGGGGWGMPMMGGSMPGAFGFSSGPSGMGFSPFGGGGSPFPPGSYGSPGSSGSRSTDLLGAAANTGCGYLPPGPARDLCRAGANILFGSGDPRSEGLSGSSSSCPSGYRWDGQRCVEEGMGGMVHRALPGGNPGALVPMGGAFGVPGLSSAVVQRLVHLCPTGFILGKDNLCYAKGSIPRKWRKNPPARRPLLSASDGKTLTRAKSLQKKLRRVTSKFVPHKRSSAPKGRKR